MSGFTELGIPYQINFENREDWLDACLKIVSEGEGVSYEDAELLLRDFGSWNVDATLVECEKTLIRSGVKKKK